MSCEDFFFKSICRPTCKPSCKPNCNCSCCCCCCHGSEVPPEPPVECECACQSMGELIVNGGMEQFTLNVPTGWTAAPDQNDVSPVTQQGRVHSGNSAVNMTNGVNLSQTVPAEAGCFYQLSFFAHGNGAQVGLIATVTFVTPSGSVNGLTITVQKMDLGDANRQFAYFRGITTKAPAETTSAIINFFVDATGGQSLDLDDVSFSVS